MPGLGPDPDHGLIESIEASAITVPTDQPEADGTARWDSTTIVVVTVTSAGLTGTGWTYGPPACADVVDRELADVVVGRDPMAVTGTWTAMVRSVRNATRAGVVGYAISAVDVACWDLKARLLGVPLIDLFGAVRESVPVYGSGGFTTYDDERLTSQVAHWVHDLEIPRVKIKIGQDRGGAEDRDVERVARARAAIGADARLFVDANGAYDAKQAVRVLHACDDANVTWYEEPVSSDDLSGLRLVREAVDADVAAGEYGTDIGYFRRMCAADAVDCLQIDATRCGGYTEWLRAAAVAAAYEVPISAHCAPQLHASVAAATPNLRHIELFHDHDRIEQLLFEGARSPAGGAISPDRAATGHGLTVRPEALAEFGDGPIVAGSVGY